MKISVKGIVISIMALLVIGYIAGAAWWSSHRANTSVCEQMTIVITDYAKRRYVSVDELTDMLRKHDLYPVGKVVANIPIEQIERAIVNHPMVRHAQCYVTPTGVVRIRLTQREPVLRVVTGDASYFVDSDHLRMPIRESVTTPVMIVTGNVGERMACSEIVEMVQWITADEYWNEKVESVHVVNPKTVYLVQRPDGTHLILGEVSGYQQKLAKLRKLYDKGFDQIGWQTYRELDLRFRGQVVGRN